MKTEHDDGNILGVSLITLRKLVHAINRGFFFFVFFFFFFFFSLKIENFQLKKFNIFSYFCSKHRLCVHVRTASAIYPCIPQFCYTKVGFKGVNITGTCFHDEKTSIGHCFLRQIDISEIRIFILKNELFTKISQNGTRLEN